MRILTGLFIILVYSGTGACEPGTNRDPEKPDPSRVERALKDLQILGVVKATDVWPSIELGDSFVGELVEGICEIKNETNSPLTIEKISTTCGCTMVYPEKQDWPPGSTVRLITRVKPGKHGAYGVGIKIELKDGTFACSLKGRALSAVEIATKEIEFGDDGKDGVVELRVNDARVSLEEVSLKMDGNELDRVSHSEREEKPVLTFRVPRKDAVRR